MEKPARVPHQLGVAGVSPCPEIQSSDGGEEFKSMGDIGDVFVLAIVHVNS